MEYFIDLGSKSVTPFKIAR